MEKIKDYSNSLPIANIEEELKLISLWNGIYKKNQHLNKLLRIQHQLNDESVRRLSNFKKMNHMFLVQFQEYDIWVIESSTRIKTVNLDNIEILNAEIARTALLKSINKVVAVLNAVNYEDKVVDLVYFSVKKRLDDLFAKNSTKEGLQNEIKSYLTKIEENKIYFYNGVNELSALLNIDKTEYCCGLRDKIITEGINQKQLGILCSVILFAGGNKKAIQNAIRNHMIDIYSAREIEQEYAQRKPQESNIRSAMHILGLDNSYQKGKHKCEVNVSKEVISFINNLL